MKNVKTVNVAALFASACILNAAGTIGYWQFDGTDGAAVTAVSSEVNNASFTSAVVNGSGGAGATAPTYSSNVATGAGEVILDGVGGAVVNSTNSTSIRFVGAGGGVGQILQIDDGSGGAAGLFEPTGAFTLEAFVSSEGSTFSPVFNKDRFNVSSSAGFQTDFTATRTRLLGAGLQSAVADTNGTAGGAINNGDWHHISVVFDGTNTINMYYDYVLLNTIAGDPTSNWDNAGELSIGGLIGNANLFSGYVDELRYTDEALTTAQFLVVGVPEPATYAMLTGLLALGAVMIRRRK